MVQEKVTQRKAKDELNIKATHKKISIKRANRELCGVFIRLQERTQNTAVKMPT